MTSLPRTAVIGSGISGLTAGKALADKGVPYQCFEASDDIGGNWYFKNPNGHSSAYRSLHIDTSRQSLSFKDFPMPPHYPDFPHHSEVHAYLKEYAEKFGLRQHIRFNTRVQKAERLPQGGWRLTLANGAQEYFDALLVGNGHHWHPNWPTPAYPGKFDGTQIHSHDYIDPTEPLNLVGKRVLVVGIGNSAVDIVSELARKGVAEKVYISTRSGAYIMPKYLFGKPIDQVVKTTPWLHQGLQRWLGQILPRIASGRVEDFGLPKPNHKFLEAHPTVSSELLLRLGSGDAKAKVNVAALEGKQVRFEDGSREDVDVIIWSTGYKITFPFFDENFLSAPGNVLPLWKRMFKPEIDDLAFIGLAQTIPTLFPFVELQSKLAARWLAGEWLPPDAEEMRRDMAKDEAANAHYGKRQRHTMQVDYYSYEYEARRRMIPAGEKRAQKLGPRPLAGRAETQVQAQAAASKRAA